jgi:hypothetical protein
MGIHPNQAPGNNPGQVFVASPGIGSYRIAGVTRDANGNPLAGCSVAVFYTGTDKIYTKVVSDAGGNWTALVPDTTTRFYAVTYKAGSPDVSGTTVNTLTGT